jgi:hypothetical protein
MQLIWAKILLLSIFLVGCSPKEAVKEASPSPKVFTNQQLPSIEPTPFVEASSPSASPIVVTGIIYPSALSTEEREKFELQASDYQLIITTKTSKTTLAGFFLDSTNPELGKDVGKCVKVMGLVKPGWDRVDFSKYLLNNHYTYQRLAQIVSSVQLTQASDCASVFDDKISNFPEPDKREYSGIIERFERPSPDINYDYLIKLTQAIDEEYGSSGIKGKMTSQIILIPDSLEAWEGMEQSIGESINIVGYKSVGYAESEYLLVTQVKLGSRIWGGDQ